MPTLNLFMIILSHIQLFSKCLAAVVKHFDDFHEDQFDFHAYCIRKVTLRAYFEVLKFEDNLWGEDYYFTAASGTIKIYLHLHDNPATSNEDKEPDYSKMTAAERKKAKSIARKKRIQAEKKEAERLKREGAKTEEGAQKKSDKKSPIDEDPDGEELLKKDALEECKKYSAILSKHCKNRVETWALQFAVSVRRKKWLLALQALFKMRSIDSENAIFFSCLVDFASKIPDFGEIPGAVKQVVSEATAELLNGKTLSDYIAEAAERAKSNRWTALSVRVAIAEALVKHSTTSSVDVATALILDGGTDSKDVNVDTCRRALTALKTFSPASTKEWISVVQKKFPRIKELS